MDRFWGKYRGTVVDIEDPLMLGRLLVTVPQALGEVLTSWAMPCVPYAGPQVGLCMTPPVGAAVWIEFEGGDLDYPVWTGCYWREGERPAEATPATRQLIRTGSATLMLDDTPGEGGFKLTVTDPAVAAPLRIRGSSEGLAIECGETRATFAEGGGVAIMAGIGQLSVTEDGVSVKHGATSIALVAPEVSIVSGDGQASVTPEGVLLVHRTAAVELSAPLVTITNG